MDDWVRAINSARRRLSEMEEEARVKRSGSVPTAPLTMPLRERPEAIDTHQGTFSSVFTSAGGSFTASPTTAGGYFAPRAPSVPHNGASPLNTPGALPPSSPMDTTNTLSSQMAGMSLPKSPSMSANARMPVGRNMSIVSGRREPSGSSIGSSEQYQQYIGSLGLQQNVSSDEDEPFFSDPQSAFQAQTPGVFNTQAAPVDPNKVILSAYLMKRSKGRGRKVWRKRWFYLTSQGLTYTKSHMVCCCTPSWCRLTRRMLARSALFPCQLYLTLWNSSQMVLVPTHPIQILMRRPKALCLGVLRDNSVSEGKMHPRLRKSLPISLRDLPTSTSFASSLRNELLFCAHHQKKMRSSGLQLSELC